MKLNTNMYTITKIVKRVELNTQNVNAVLNTQTFDLI